MRYVIAIFLPPLAVLMCGKLFQTVLSVALTVACALGVVFTFGLTWIIPVIHAWAVIAGHKNDTRTDRIVSAIRQTGRHG